MTTTSALIVASGLIISGVLAGGRYDYVPLQGDSIARADRFTGEVDLCIPGTAHGCAWSLDLRDNTPTPSPRKN